MSLLKKTAAKKSSILRSPSIKKLVVPRKPVEAKKFSEAGSEDDEDKVVVRKRPPQTRRPIERVVVQDAEQLDEEEDYDEEEEDDEEDSEDAGEDGDDDGSESTSREIAVLDPNLEERPKFMSKTQYKKVISSFGSAAPAIIKMLEYNNNDGALVALNRNLMQTLIDILPVAENQVRRSKGRSGFYQFNQTLAQIRELAADIQAAQDKGMVSTKIMERFLRPLFQDLAVQIVVAFTNISAEASKHLDKEDAKNFDAHVKQMQDRIADYLTKRFDALKVEVSQAFS